MTEFQGVNAPPLPPSSLDTPGGHNTAGLYSPLHMSWGWSSTSFLILTWPSSEGREGVDDAVDAGLAIGRSYEEDNNPGTEEQNIYRIFSFVKL